MVKTIKQEIILKEKDKKKKEDLTEALRDLRYHTWKALNKCMTYQYAHTQGVFILKDKNIEVPKPKEVLGKTMRGFLYDIVKEEMEMANANIVSSTSKFAEEQFAKDKVKGLLKGDCSLSQFKKSAPIFLHNRNLSIIENPKGFSLKLHLFSREKKKEFGIDSVEFDIVRPKGHAKSTLRKIMSGEYKQGGGSINYNPNKDKWFISISYHFHEKEFNGKNIMGVDIGIHNALAFAVYNPETEKHEWLSFKECLIPGGEVEEMRSQMQKRRRSAGINSKMGKGGRGYKRRNSKLLKLSEKEKNFRETFNGKVSSYLIKMAKKYNCELIQIEDLEGFNPKNAFLKNWAYYDLQMKIICKATEEGIEVVKVKPQYTTKRCSHCGNINMGIDNTSIHEWVCPECGEKHNRDYNAAKNIALPDIEKIIEEQLEIGKAV